jgi:HAD superfamily hydrolase (TIGR01509 family)
MSGSIRAVVFDMDGVLIDARDWHYEALNRALALVGHEITRHDHLTTYDGLPTRRKLDMLTLERGLPRELHPFISEMKQRYTMEIVATRCKPVFHHQYARARLRAAGLLLGVASNSIRSTVVTMMRNAALEEHLDLVLSFEDVGRPKPDPHIYLEAMRRLGVAMHETLVVEDNEHGIAAATASGAHVLVVGSPDDVTLEAITRRIASLEQVAA